MKYLIDTKRLSIWWSAQNLNKYGSIWREGRGWLYINSLCFGLSWYFLGRSSTAMDIELGGEEEFKFHIAIYRLFAFWFTISQILPRRWTRNWKWWDHSWGRCFGVTIHHGAIWVDIFCDTMDSGHNRFWWQDVSINYIDLLLGQSHHTKKVLDKGFVEVPLPEGIYITRWTKELHTWKRPRWFADRVTIFDLEPQTPIPVPGKGENSWDMDDDAIERMSCSAHNLAEAVGKLVASALDTRQRYGWEETAR